jgi:hypothetical protein
MQLVVTQADSGRWLQLEGESPAEWQTLEALTGNGISHSANPERRGRRSASP